MTGKKDQEKPMLDRRDLLKTSAAIIGGSLLGTAAPAEATEVETGGGSHADPLPPATMSTAQPLAVKAGLLLDVKTGRLLENQMILIEGGRIKEVDSASLMQARLVADAKVVDLSRFTVLPGLIDCHTHQTLDFYHGPFDRITRSYARQALLGARNALTTIRAGFTTVRNLAGDGYSDVALRDASDAGDVIGPRMLASGPALSITGGHFDINELAPQFHYSSEGVADGITGVTRKVRENIKYGADVIKFMATGGVMSKGDNPALAQYSLDEMQAIVATAHGLGRKVAAHAHGALGIKSAVLAGVDSVEHGSCIDDECIQLMKERGTYLVPTLFVNVWLMENAERIGLPPYSVEKGKAIEPIQQRNVTHALHAGIKVAFGTDAGVYPHGLNAHEFPLLVKLGLTPLEAIQAATINAAELLGWSDHVGTLETGKFADLLAVEGNPLRDVSVFEQVTFVMKGGQVVKPGTLEKV